MSMEKTALQAPVATGPELPRVLGLFSLVGIVIGTMIGSGIFINPANVARELGSPALMLAAWALGGVLSFFGALAIAELGAMHSRAGGIYVYLREAYGPLPAFLFGWALILVIESGTIATLAVGFASKYLPFFVDLTPWQQRLAALALIAALALVNVLGVRKGAYLMNALTSVKFIALIAVCTLLFLFARGSTANFAAAAPGGGRGAMGGFGVALVAVLWAYKGFETGSYSAGELRDPQRKLPLGLFIGTLLVILLYVLANLAYLYVFPAARMAGSARIAADVMAAVFGPAGAAAISLIILLSMAGTANGHIMTSSRVFYAMARDGLFFKEVGRVHPRYLTPHVSIAVLASWAAVLSLSGTFEQLYSYVIFGFWIFMGLTVAGVIVLRRRRPDLPRPYRTWGYPFTPLLFVLSAVLLTVNSLVHAFWNSFIGLVLILLGVPVYFLWRRGRPAPAAD
jgi:APA family basic amino acid/polyamine antiporter